MPRRTLYLLLTCVVMLWGTSFAAAKIGMQYSGTIEFLLMRLFFSALIFSFILLCMPKNNRKIKLKDVPYMFYLATIGIGGYFIVQYNAIKYTTTLNASLIISTSPIFIAIYSISFYKEKMSLKKILGIILCFIGVLLIISKGKLSVFSFSKTIKGDIIMLINAVMLAGFSIGAKRILNKYDSFTAIAYINIFAFFIVLLFALISNEFTTNSLFNYSSYISRKSILSALYLGITCSVFGYAVWYRAIKEIGATRTAVFNYINPLVAAITSFILFDEGINVFVIIGGIFVIFGVTLNNINVEKNIRGVS